MIKIGNIIRGIWYSITDNKKTREMAQQRLWFCYDRDERMPNQPVKKGCPSRKGNICGECGCVLKFKTRVQEEACPLLKW